MKYIGFHLLGTLALTLLFGFMALSGWCPNQVWTEQAPVTVRDNPASYRPSYVVWTGYRVPPSSSGGGWSSGK